MSRRQKKSPRPAGSPRPRPGARETDGACPERSRREWGASMASAALTARLAGGRLSRGAHLCPQVVAGYGVRRLDAALDARGACLAGERVVRREVRDAPLSLRENPKLCQATALRKRQPRSGRRHKRRALILVGKGKPEGRGPRPAPPAPPFPLLTRHREAASHELRAPSCEPGQERAASCKPQARRSSTPRSSISFVTRHASSRTDPSSAPLFLHPRWNLA